MAILFLGPKPLFGFLWLVLVIITVLAVVFGKRPRTLNRLLWILLIIFVPVVGVLLYWILAR